MIEELKDSIVCIKGPDNIPIGAGCLVTPHHVVTCAHVVDVALARDRGSREKPQEAIDLDFAFAAGPRGRIGTVTGWWPYTEAADPPCDGLTDLAVLWLESIPSSARPAMLAGSAAVEDLRFETFGFPAGHPYGVMATGRTAGQRADGWVQLEARHRTGIPIQGGFSGAPVWLPDLQAVAGIVAQAERDRRTRVGFIIPAEVLRAACPAIPDCLVKLGIRFSPLPGFRNLYMAVDPIDGFAWAWAMLKPQAGARRGSPMVNVSTSDIEKFIDVANTRTDISGRFDLPTYNEWTQMNSLSNGCDNIGLGFRHNDHIWEVCRASSHRNGYYYLCRTGFRPQEYPDSEMRQADVGFRLAYRFA